MFYVITKNLNWEMLTENLVAIKRWDGVRMKNFNITGVHWKTQFLRGRGSRETSIGGFA